MQATQLQDILHVPVIPVYYNDNPETCASILRACYSGGIRTFEFTNRGAAAADNFRQLLQLRDQEMPDLKMGIGTIKTAADADQFISIGADFIVSPIVSREVAAVAAQPGILWIPGCMTPTEIALAEDLGANLVKLFPGDTLGTGFLKAIKPLFSGLKFMPTGGVEPNRESITTWFDAGASAVGLGSKLFAGTNEAGFGQLSLRCEQLIKALPL
ncbi:bifunctional 4-hydroxy-2-oxoglutarate aldolase/2-dehydro-3-deoxy-phosphogluconate aldolase [Pedobacter yulinensis]|uniref:Bifunctional 4-hydroxy-2-oxoglutarate aldolase/2-dehydro-3-deoxy-phosphogluconate aldolase n=1 Tax=Pedobacter yulinensis TaxID=2126353 RepID=A0A2T3HLZ9_9SPHI|nr:bifunctional 4-hydroxy-2-oxoglutarate aldolase/2-dehydro-3-deoxy-phosphogluconate aldolase [Pedobacter yulinensis]PST83443.1 bifunctional 4-hydroxy-2-oxoglutarate aldolase/2-dehydro-3-deoxy-phosphogluconate aldolase [Pedobacter yulinensis]